jgi:hypothetical protein
LEVAAWVKTFVDVPKISKLLQRLEAGLKNGDSRYRAVHPFYAETVRQGF